MQKYRNKKVCVNGLYFDSKKEANRYIKLLEKQQNGEISNLETQVKYVLIPSQYETYQRFGKTGKRLKDGKRLLEKECSYIADFEYYDKQTREMVVEDTKGFKTKDYIIKRKLMLHVHGIRIREV